ncbi:hypothetical protein JOM56_003784 [Amanita muscaria]
MQPTGSTGTQRTPLNSPSVKKKKYFVVTIGRKTGVFDDWHVCFLSSQMVPNHLYRTCEEATAVYLECKRKGLVRVSHLPGDNENVFGPESEAMQ